MPREHKGQRRFVATRLPENVAQRLTVRAERNGLTVTDALHLAVVDWLGRTDENTHRNQPQGVGVR